MSQAFNAIIFLLLCTPLNLAGQHIDPELPLPRVKGISMVVKMHYAFVQIPPDQMRWDKDTESVFLVGPDGYAYARYLCERGHCSGKELYEYNDGQLIRSSYFKTLDRHTLFTPAALHSHRLVSEDTWLYAGSKVSLTRHFYAKTLTREIRYAYDEDGRVAEETHHYPKQSFVYYPTHYDYVQYQYAGDSVYKLAYEQGRLRDSTAYTERRNSAGQVTERSQISRDGRHYQRELTRYDSSGRISVYESFSDRPSVQPDGKVLRADRVEYTYDQQGRPDEVRYMARGIKRWWYKYNYLR